MGILDHLSNMLDCSSGHSKLKKRRQLQNAAVKALNYYIPAYLALMENKGFNDIMSIYLEQLTGPNVAARRRPTLALGVLPFEFLTKWWKVVLMKLCCSCEIEDNPEDRDAEARVNAVKGLISVLFSLLHLLVLVHSSELSDYCVYLRL
ncbi:hypothetical protein ACS0TY_009018 [Phlomoides rotata]